MVKLTHDELQDRKANLAQRLEHPIRRLDQKLEDNIKLAAENDSEAASLDARCHRPFPHRERIAELRQRHQEILDQLNAEAQADTNDADIKQDDEEAQMDSNSPQPGLYRTPPHSGSERLDDLKRNAEPPDPDDPSPEL